MFCQLHPQRAKKKQLLKPKTLNLEPQFGGLLKRTYHCVFRAGADPERRNGDGERAEGVAERGGHEDVALLLGDWATADNLLSGGVGVQ